MTEELTSYQRLEHVNIWFSHNLVIGTESQGVIRFRINTLLFSHLPFTFSLYLIICINDLILWNDLMEPKLAEHFFWFC